MKIKLDCPHCKIFLCGYDLSRPKSTPTQCKKCKWVWTYDGNKKTWERDVKRSNKVVSSGVRFN